MNKIQKLEIFRSRILHYTFNGLLSFGIGCISMSVIAKYFGIQYVLGAALASSIYYIISTFCLQPKMYSLQSSKFFSKAIFYLNLISFSPSVYLAAFKLHYSEIMIAFGITAIFCFIAYIISQNIPVTLTQLRIVNCIMYYFLSSFVAYLISTVVYFLTGYNLFRYIKILYPEILMSSLLVAIGVFFINYHIQQSEHIAEKLTTEEELDQCALIMALNVSTWAIIILREILYAMSRNRRR